MRTVKIRPRVSQSGVDVVEVEASRANELVDPFPWVGWYVDHGDGSMTYYSKADWVEAKPVKVEQARAEPTATSWDALRDRCLREAERMLDSHRFPEAEFLVRMARLIEDERRSR